MYVCVCNHCMNELKKKRPLTFCMIFLNHAEWLNLALAIAAWSQFLNKVNKYMQKRWLYKLKHDPKHNPPLLLAIRQLLIVLPCL